MRKFAFPFFRSQRLPLRANFLRMHTFRFRPRILHDLRHYRRSDLSADLLSGLVVGIVALPLAIAFAIAASPGGDVQHTIGPGVGILTAIVAGVVISALGGSRVQIGGPTGAFIVIIYGVVERFGLSGLLVATIMAGIFLVLLGVFRLGSVIKFIPYPIVVGFTSGIALTIFTTQVKDFLGLHIAGAVPAGFVDKWVCYFRHIATVDWAVLAVAVATVLLIVGTQKVAKRVHGRCGPDQCTRSHAHSHPRRPFRAYHRLASPRYRLGSRLARPVHSSRRQFHLLDLRYLVAHCPGHRGARCH